MQKVRTLFIGTSSFAVPALRKLLSAGFAEIVGIVTQPDKPAGRKQELSPSAVKFETQKLSLDVPVFQPDKLKNEAEEILKQTYPDLVIVASYGQMLPGLMIDYPKHKCLNIHASILPDLRGAVPIPVAILKGYKSTGVSIPIMTEGLDNGPVIASAEVEILDDDTTESLTKRLAETGSDKLIEILPDWIGGRIEAIPQDESKATLTGMSDVSKEKAEIDWDKSAEEIDRMVRAFYPWPVAWAWIEFKGNKRLKIYKSAVSDFESGKSSGEFFKKDKKLFVQTGKGSLELAELQMEGKNKAEGKDYLFLVRP